MQISLMLLLSLFKQRQQPSHCISQVLIQKDKVDVNSEKGVQISILPNKIATKWWLNIVMKESKLHITFIFYYKLMLLFDQKTGIEFNGSFSFT